MTQHNGSDDTYGVLDWDGKMTDKEREQFRQQCMNNLLEEPSSSGFVVFLSSR